MGVERIGKGGGDYGQGSDICNKARCAEFVEDGLQGEDCALSLGLVNFKNPSS